MRLLDIISVIMLNETIEVITYILLLMSVECAFIKNAMTLSVKDFVDRIFSFSKITFQKYMSKYGS